jgi:hypothetical protein
MPKYNVVTLGDGFGKTVISVDSRSEFCKSTATKHAKAWNRSHIGVSTAFVVEVGAEVVIIVGELCKVQVTKGSTRWSNLYAVTGKGEPLIKATMLTRKEAFALARKLYGVNCTIIVT